MLKRLQRRTYEILEYSSPDDRATQIDDIIITAFIILNALEVVLETMPEFQDYQHFFDTFDTIAVVVFTVEFLLRLWAITEKPTFHHPIKGRFRFVFSLYGMIDLLAILPFYFLYFFPQADFVRMFRVFRLIRLMKLIRYSRAFRSLDAVIRAKKNELRFILFMVAMLLLFASTLMFYVENPAQPDKFTSIPASMWWAVVTMTTVGYGDVFPITPLGKILSSCIALLGVGIFALPAGILASGFSEEMQRQKNSSTEEPSSCPHCGGHLTKKGK